MEPAGRGTTGLQNASLENPLTVASPLLPSFWKLGGPLKIIRPFWGFSYLRQTLCFVDFLLADFLHGSHGRNWWAILP